jgi:hypothetical protein
VRTETTRSVPPYKAGGTDSTSGDTMPMRMQSFLRQSNLHDGGVGSGSEQGADPSERLLATRLRPA